MSGTSRRSLSLDGEWRFVADPERVHGAGALPGGEAITVPGCWEAQVLRPYGIVTAWYHREVEVPADWDGGRIVLRFGAVMYRCTAWVDGRRVGDHEGGYTSFAFDVTDALHPGESHRVAVQVVNPLNGLAEFPAFDVERVALAEELEPDLPLSEAPHGKQTWYSSHSGLWQSVELVGTADLALGRLRIRPDLPGEAVDVAWSFEAGDPTDGRTELELVVRDPDGVEVARHRDAVAGGGEVRLAIPSPRAWDIGVPNLYTITATVHRDDIAVDEVHDRFGMREIRTDRGRILLNGRPIYLLAALDQDFYADSISTPPDRAFLDRQLRLAREMGLNLLRVHIKVPDPMYLDAADEAGILLWCELPNWTAFTTTSAGRGRATLQAMVEAMGNHPSIVIWTIINEDWGTQLRWEARDRRWLRETYEWLKELDPTRLVVDNSACETPQTPNFHVRTDLADFHLYFLAPDNAERWRNAIEDFARRPAWLWSPHGDAEERGDEPLVLSEFGGWGLPRVTPLLSDRRREPWWFSTGRTYFRPTGVRRRFAAYGLDRIWDTVDDLADATQRHQFQSLQYEIGQMRRHTSIQGYVITELTDLYWEANGLLDIERRPKAYHDRLAGLNAPDVVVADLRRWDLCSREPFEAELTLSSYGDDPPDGGRVDWALEIDGLEPVTGSIVVPAWPTGGALVAGRIHADVPDVSIVADARLVLEAVGDDGRSRARDHVRLAVLPASVRKTAHPMRAHVHDPMDIHGIADRVAALGHELVAAPDAELIVTPELTADILRRVEEDGLRVLVLVRTRSALRRSEDLARRVDVVLRKHPDAGAPGQRSPWEGDWVSGFSWMLPATFPGLPDRNPLDFAYEEVLPDHVLTGYVPGRHRDEVPAGMFVGWVHAPAALVWTFRQGRGAVTLTTLHVAPERGPVATALLDGLLRYAANADRRTTPREDGRPAGEAPIEVSG